MAGTTKIKAKLKDGIVEVKALATHPMLSYQEAERAKKEANFITYVIAKVGDKVVYEASTSQFLSTFAFIFVVPAILYPFFYFIIFYLSFCLVIS